MEKSVDISAERTSSNDTCEEWPGKDETPGELVTIDVVLENESVWSRFHSVGTEMIITEQGRRMFPWCRFRLAGLHPKRCYSLLMDVVPADDFCHRWNGDAWEPDGPGEPRVKAPPCFHPDSPALGQRWMDGPVSFYKVKLTHDTVDQDSCVALRPMHRYQPRLYIVPHHQRAVSLKDPEVQMFTFTKTEFYAVTSFQNPKIIQLKINCNPFMLAFTEDGEKKLRHAVSDRCQSLSAVNHSHDDNSKDHISAQSQSDEELVLSNTKTFICDQIIRHLTTEESTQPEMLSDSSEAHRHVSRNSGDSSENVIPAGMSSSLHRQQTLSCRSAACKAHGVACRSRRMRKARKAKSKRWSNVKYTKAAVHLGPADMTMQPDLEDVDGMLFVSFGVKEALDVHVVKMRRSVEPSSSSSLSRVKSENSQCNTEEEIISQKQHILLQHLKKLKNRQIIHPALQEVGLKLNLLDPAVPIDLHYLGVSLTSSALSVNNPKAFPDVPFVSQTRKTDHPAKIKDCNTSGQSSIDSSINRSAFFSDELEEYLESEAQQICQRAAVFSTSSSSSVVYQMPEKSSSYVRTLDSVLQTRGVTAAPPTPSTNRHNPLHMLPSKSAVKITLESSGRSRQTTPVTVKNVQRSPHEHHPSTHSKPEAGGHLSHCFSFSASSTHAKNQLKLLEKEQEAVRHGKSHTFVTTERAEFALTSLITSGKSKKSVFSKHRVSQDVCTLDFCRLGCVCESLNRKIRGPTHCRRLQCMFGCDCFKHKVFLIRPPERSQTHVGKMPLMAFPVDPQSHVMPNPSPIITRLWNRRSDDHDTEVMSTPTSNPPALRSRVYVPRPNPVVHEMEKDTVYRYLESKMTCARVREYNSNPPPQFYIIPVKKKTRDIEGLGLTHLSGMNPEDFHYLDQTSEVSRPSPAHTQLMSQSLDKNAAASGEPEATKVLEIISECNWEAQRTLVLKELFHCINMNLLSSSLFIDIYKVDFLSTTLKKEDGHCTLSYKVCVSLSETSRRTDKKNKANNQNIAKEQINVNTSACQVQEPRDKQSNNKIHIRSLDNETKSLRTLRFLSGVIPAGCLKASVKMSGCPRPIQVNGKTYTKAKLSLGQMGSLHPASRLAAYITGRMKPMCPARMPSSLKDTQHSPLNPVLIPNLSSTPNHITSSNPRLAVPNSIPLLTRKSHSFVSPPNPGAPAKPNIVLPAAALPPGQHVVLQPIPGVSGANLCQFNGQTIQLFPLPAVSSIHLQTKDDPHLKAQIATVQPPQMIQTTVKPQEVASFPKLYTFIAPKILFLPGTTGLNFSATTAQGLHRDSSGNKGTFSFRICPPAEGQTDVGESSSTILLPGGYRLTKLPVEKNSPSADKASASHRVEKCIAQNKHHSNRDTESDSFPEADAKQEDQIVNPASSRRIDITSEVPMTHESSVHIKTEPSEIPTQPPITSHAPVDCSQDLLKTEPYDSSSTHHSLKQEPLCLSSSRPVDNPENTEESNNPEDFVVVKIETLDEMSETSQLSDHMSDIDSPSSHPDKHLKIQLTENNSPGPKTQQTGAVFEKPVSVIKIKSSLDTQQHPEVKTHNWPYRLMQKALNTYEEDTEEQRHDCDASFDADLSSSINDSDDTFKCLTQDWTSEDSCSEEDINIETSEENGDEICWLWTKRKRKSKKAERHTLRDASGEIQEGQMQYDAVEHVSNLCVYKRAWHLNRSARKRRRRAELHQSFDSLKRTLDIDDPNMSVQDVFLQACEMIGSLEHRSRSLMEKKKSLIQKHCRCISQISQLSAETGLQYTGNQKSTAVMSSHTHSVAKRPSGLPKIVLRAFSKI